MNVLGGILEGVIAIMGLTAGVIVGLTALFAGDAPGSAELEGSYRNPVPFAPVMSG